MAADICGERRATKRWTTRDIFLLTLLIAVPTAFFSQYYRLVTNTVDGVRIPLKDASFSAVVLASCALGAIAYLLVHWKLRRSQAVLVTMVALSLIPILRLVSPGALEIVDLYRPRGLQAAQAQENYEAAALVATAVRSYFARTSQWPDSWAALTDDLSTAINKGIEFPLHPNPPQMPVRIPTSHWSPEAVANFVEIDFNPDLDDLATQSWTNFTAIRVKKPAYNMYREQFTELIRAISAERQVEPGK